MLETDRRE